VSMDEHDLEVHRDEGPCHQCGAPYEPHVKWNGGNVVTVFLPTCECAERATEELWGRMIARIQKSRRENS
jgi:hypothetical protein